MIITAFNPDVSQLETTYLAQSYNLGATSIEVRNNQIFSNNTRIQLGAPGLASTEIVTVTGAPNANGTTMTIGSTLFPHEADTPIYYLQFDQVQFYRSTTGISGTYSLLSTVNLDVTNANLITTYNDTSAVTGYYYYTVMYNSVTTVASSQSDSVPAGGWARNQVGYVIDQVYTSITDANEDNLSRSELIGYMNEVNDDLMMQVARPYSFLYKRTVLSRVAGANTLAAPSDMMKFDRMDYNYVNNNTNPATNNTYTVEVVSLDFFRNRHITNENDSSTQDDMVQEMAWNEATNTFDYYPYSATSSPAVWYLYYWSIFSTITSEGNTLQTPSPRIYIEYIKYMYYLKRSVSEPEYLQISDRYLAQYTNEKIRYKSQDRKDTGTPRRFENPGYTRRSYRR